MSLTIKDAVSLEKTNKFLLISGERGLSNKVKAIGVIEHEVKFKDAMEDTFRKGDFLITNFYLIKDEPEKIYEIVKELVKIKVSGLAIKNIYFKDIDEKTKKYADENKFPIFIYDKKICLEDIIFDVVKALKDDEKNMYLASKIYGLINSRLNSNMVKKIAYEINDKFKNFIQVSLFKGENDMSHMISKINNGPYRDIYSNCLLFDGCALLINTFDDEEFKLSYFLDRNGVSAENYKIGISSKGFILSELDEAIKESIIAFQVASIYDIEKLNFDELGIYKFIVPCIDNEWVRKYHRNFIKKIKDYDEKYEMELLDTARIFIEFDGNYKKTSEVMYQHSNTIRYRISKIKEIVDINTEISGFYEQLSMAIRIDKLISNVNFTKKF